jgi:hypothetical protein
LLAETQRAAILRQEAQARKEGARINANDSIDVGRLVKSMQQHMPYSKICHEVYGFAEWRAIFLSLL